MSILRERVWQLCALNYDRVHLSIDTTVETLYGDQQGGPKGTHLDFPPVAFGGEMAHLYKIELIFFALIKIASAIAGPVARAKK